MRQYLTKRERIAMVQAQNGRCTVCGEKLRPGNIEFDHCQAIVHGGGGKPDRAICAVPCHRDKSRADIKAAAKVTDIAYGKPRKGPPMPGSRSSNWKHHMNGTWSRR